MRQTSKMSIRIRNISNHSDEYCDVIEPQQAKFWIDAAPLLKSRMYQHNGCKINIRINWALLGQRIARDHALLAPVRTGGAWTEEMSKKLFQPLRLPAIVEIEGSNDLCKHDWYPGFFVEYFSFEVFTIANLSCPGAADFSSLSVHRENERSPMPLRLSSFYFSEWMLNTLEGKTPAASKIPVGDVIDWFQSINPHVTQRAENSTQRALFALYELCRSDGHVDFIIWLFHALESLLSTKVGENFSGLVRRASLLLNLDAKESKILSKQLRKLYDVRSSFVHGGYEAPHPLHSEPIDKRLENDYMKLLDLGIYGFRILAALMQAMIKNEISQLRFEERIFFPKEHSPTFMQD